MSAVPGPSNVNESQADRLPTFQETDHSNSFIVGQDAASTTQSSSSYQTYQTAHPQYGLYYTQGHIPASTSMPYAYYQLPANVWSGNLWPSPTHAAGNSYSPYAHLQTQSAHERSAADHSQSTSLQIPGVLRSPFPPPSPPPRDLKHWDRAIRAFLSAAGLTQALQGLGTDMLVMNSEWERRNISAALDVLVQDILALKTTPTDEESDKASQILAEETPFEERKLEYLHLANGAERKSPTSITKDISRFLARNRARNDDSNRQEFLHSLVATRPGLQTGNDTRSAEREPSCARTDAKAQNRDLQMKYDIAKNEDGPLRKTLSSESDGPLSNQQGKVGQGCVNSSERFPALDERLRSVESHLAVRYVPAPPKSLLDRLRFLEDHIMHLEKEYPPWAALHFNQPHRGWPPPPRPIPIIVPSHLTSAVSNETHSRSSDGRTRSAPTTAHLQTSDIASEGAELAANKAKAKAGRNSSSLQRAVMEKLEVQKAMHDLARTRRELS